MVCQTAKSIEDVLRVALRITSEDERRNVRPGMKVSYFFRGENQNYQDREHDVYPSAGFKPGIYRNPKHLARESWFVNEAIRLFPEEFQSDHTTFERLTRLQHFGFPTRLADITQNVFVATAFACMKGYDDPAKLPADQRMGFVHIYRINNERIKYSTDWRLLSIHSCRTAAETTSRSSSETSPFSILSVATKRPRPSSASSSPPRQRTGRSKIASR